MLGWKGFNAGGVALLLVMMSIALFTTSRGSLVNYLPARSALAQFHR